MQQLLLVFLGGGLGSCSRYLIAKVVGEQFKTSFPLGTFTVNVLGCFLLGIILGIIERYKFPSFFGLLFVTGFCGGFTTFSSFAFENLFQLKNSSYIASFAYTFMSIIWGFTATSLGFLIVRKF